MLVRPVKSGTVVNLLLCNRLKWKYQKNTMPLQMKLSITQPCVKGHLTPFCACVAVWFLIRRNSFQSWHLWQKSLSIDLTRRLNIVIPALDQSINIFCVLSLPSRITLSSGWVFEAVRDENYFRPVTTIKASDTLDHQPIAVLFRKKKTKKRWEDERPRCACKLEES